MLLFRSISVGLLGAVLYFVATPASPTIVTRASPHALAAIPEPAPPVTVIDVAPGVDATRIAGLVRLEPGERISHVGDRAVTSELEAGAAIALHPRGRGGSFVDLAVATPGSPARRVLVLLH